MTEKDAEIERLREERDHARASVRTVRDNYRERLADANGEITRLRTALKIEQSCSLGSNLCPDHRDKQKGKPCLACEIARLKRERDALQAEKLDMLEIQHAGAEEIAALHTRAERAEAALLWAVGLDGDFRTRHTGEGPYYWRKELCERAGMTWNGETYVFAALQPEPSARCETCDGEGEVGPHDEHPHRCPDPNHGDTPIFCGCDEIPCPTCGGGA